MNRIPTPDEIDSQDNRAANAQQEKKLTDELTAALNRRDFNPTINWRFTDSQIQAVSLQFVEAGWVVVNTSESRSGTTFEICRV